MDEDELVSFCVIEGAEDAKDFQLTRQAIDLLESDDLSLRKVVLIAILEQDTSPPKDGGDDVGSQNAQDPAPPVANSSTTSSADGGVRGVFLLKKPFLLQELDAVAFCCVLRNVDLSKEPFWGSLLMVLCSQLYVLSAKAITSSSFYQMSFFLSHFLQIQVQETKVAAAAAGTAGAATESSSQDQNARLLKLLTPKFTWVALDLKQKELQGDTSSKYFEKKLQQPSKRGHDIAGQMMVHGLFGKRDCLIVKSTTFAPTSVSLQANSIRPWTCAKLVHHMTEHASIKHLFGRVLCGSLITQLVRSLAYAWATQQKIVLTRTMHNVVVTLWRKLLNDALMKYKCLIHAQVGVYEKQVIDADYLVGVTENKLLKTESIPSTVDDGQGEWSSFDEFGNLKKFVVDDKDQRHSSSALRGSQSLLNDPNSSGSMHFRRGSAPGNESTAASASSSAALNNRGIFDFLKKRAGKAFSRMNVLNSQMSTMSLVETRRLSSRSSGTGASIDLSVIQEDEEHAQDGTAALDQVSVDQILNSINSRIMSFTIPSAYQQYKSRAMPLDRDEFEAIHQDALTQAKAMAFPFVDLSMSFHSDGGNAAGDSTVEEEKNMFQLAPSVDFQPGKRNLLRAIERIKARFEVANRLACCIFCSELLRYLHAVILKKSFEEVQQHVREEQAAAAVDADAGTDTDVAAETSGRTERSGSSPIVKRPIPSNLTKLPWELLSYKTNLDAMVSQYQFISRGPLAQRVLINFFQQVIVKRVERLVERNHKRFCEAFEDQKAQRRELDQVMQRVEAKLQQGQQLDQSFRAHEDAKRASREQTQLRELEKLREAIQSAEEMIATAKQDQQKFFKSTMDATRSTLTTMGQVATKNRVFMGYLERFEGRQFLRQKWIQYFFVLDSAYLTCYRTKSDYEERARPMEKPVCISGYSIVKSRTDECKFKVVPPEAGQMLRYRAPRNVGRDVWMKKMIEATQLSR